MGPRADRRPLSRELVLATAVALADAHGVSALTMRRLAATLEVETMSLYHYVDKEALLDGVVETVIAEVAGAARAAADSGGGWHARLRRQFLAARQVMLRHPWAPQLLASRGTIPGSLYTHYDAIVGTLVDAGFSYTLAHRALHALGSLPLGFAQEIFGPAENADSSPSADPGADLASTAETLPHLVRMMTFELHDAADPTLGWCDSQVEFEFTLDLLLDGLERLRGRSG